MGREKEGEKGDEQGGREGGREGGRDEKWERKERERREREGMNVNKAKKTTTGDHRISVLITTYRNRMKMLNRLGVARIRYNHVPCNL